MSKAVTGFMLVLVCLFIFSMNWGSQVFSAWERRLAAESPTENNNSPELMTPAERESLGKKIRLAMTSFDLANGLTFQEQEDLMQMPGYRFGAFLYLIGALWLVVLMRKPRRHQI